MGTAKNGIFTPLVKLTKWAVGEDRFLSFRARVIGGTRSLLTVQGWQQDRLSNS